MNAFVSGFCGCAGAIVAAMLAALTWILIKECLGIKPKSQADINSRSLDALIERNEMTAHTNELLGQIDKSFAELRNHFVPRTSGLQFDESEYLTEGSGDVQ